MNNIATLPAPGATANLPAVAPTGFPVSYEAARQAIAQCQSPLECRTMADKAAAMAVYARMRDDPDLRNRAVRLQAWAERRWGELDKELHPDERKKNLKQNQGSHRKGDARPIGERPPDGTTDYQRKTSHRLAAIPEAEFTRQIESANPPTVTQLAAQGKAVRTPAAVAAPKAPTICDVMAALAEFCAANEPIACASALTEPERARLDRSIVPIDKWFDRFYKHLPAQVQ